ncbi:hypothetical protein ACUOA5_32475, partial [Escherichia coli]
IRLKRKKMSYNCLIVVLSGSCIHEPSLADVDSVSAAETNFSEASGPDNGFFLSGNDFMRAEEESQRVVGSFRDSLSRKKGF